MNILTSDVAEKYNRQTKVHRKKSAARNSIQEFNAELGRFTEESTAKMGLPGKRANVSIVERSRDFFYLILQCLLPASIQNCEKGDNGELQQNKKIVRNRCH